MTGGSGRAHTAVTAGGGANGGGRSRDVRMRIQQMMAVAALGALFALPAHAQSIKKIADDTHRALKTAGNQVKEAAGDVGSATHHTLQKAGNDTKTELGQATGVHKVGGDVGKAA